MKKKAVTLLEMLIVSVIISLITVATIDMTAQMAISEVTFNTDIKAKQDKINIIDKVTSTCREGTYIYEEGTGIILPGKNYPVYGNIGMNTIAVLVPKFNDDGNLLKPTSSTTSFKGIAYSFVNEYYFTGKTSTKYVLIETIFDDENLNLTVDVNDPLKIMETPVNDWSSGKSYIIAQNLIPAVFSFMNTSAFLINEEKNEINLALIPSAKGLYFPSNYGNSAEIHNDTASLANVTLRNWRETIY